MVLNLWWCGGRERESERERVMAGSNEVNLNESKVFSFISSPVLSLLGVLFHVFVVLFSEFGD